MSASAFLTMAAMVALGLGAFFVVRMDSNKIAKLAVQRAPRRSRLLTPVSAILPGAAVTVVGVVCAFAVVGLYRPGGVVAQRDLAAFETIAEASRAPAGVTVSLANYFNSLEKVVAAQKSQTLAKASFDNRALASNDTTLREACAKMLQRVGERIGSTPDLKLSETEEGLVQYCLPHLK